MESIKAAIHRLQSFSSNKKAKEVGNAIAQLSSTVTLLELSCVSENIFARLAELLRGRLQPVYHAYPSAALEYAVTILKFVHNDKILPALQDRSVIQAALWQDLIRSLVSGILDYLENTSAKSRQRIAITVNPVLCSLYFPDASGNILPYNGYLLSTVYNLLIATLGSPGVDAATLRDDIGGKRLGVTIAKTKDYLALESLLDLLGSIIPPSKGGKEKKVRFLAEVFDSEVFEDSKRILQCMATISNPDWSDTSSKIMKILADSDIAFPQPFNISSLEVNDVSVAFSTPLFVDKLGFLANLYQGESIETFQIPFSTVQDLIISGSDSNETAVILKVSKPPILGDEPMSLSKSGTLSISWNVTRTQMDTFKRALKDRKLTFERPALRKLSQVTGISLAFNPIDLKESSQALHKERINNVAQLWDLGSPNRRSNAEPTSPLVPTYGQAPDTKMEHISLIDPISDLVPVTVFVDPTATLSFSPPASGATVPVEDPEVISRDDGTSQPKVRPKNPRKRAIIVSDDDDDKPLAMMAGQTIPSGEVPNSTPKIHLSAPVDKKTKAGSEHPFTYGRATEENSDPCMVGEQIEINTSKKRVAEKDIQDVRSGKRSRPVVIPQVPLTPVLPLLKRYGKNGRGTSSVTAPGSDLDFDALPKEYPKRRTRAMKGKDAKPIVRPRPVSTKTREFKPQAVKFNSVSVSYEQSEAGADDTIVNTTVAIDMDKDGKRRAVRQSTIQASTKSKLNSSPKKEKRTFRRKASKAPWQKEDFLKKPELFSNISIPASEPPQATFSELGQQDPNPIEEVSFEDKYTEFIEPIKDEATNTSSSSPPSPSPISEPLDIVMTDLTLCPEEPRSRKKLLPKPIGPLQTARMLERKLEQQAKPAGSQPVHKQLSSRVESTTVRKKQEVPHSTPLPAKPRDVNPIERLPSPPPKAPEVHASTPLRAKVGNFEPVERMPSPPPKAPDAHVSTSPRAKGRDLQPVERMHSPQSDDKSQWFDINVNLPCLNTKSRSCLKEINASENVHSNAEEDSRWPSRPTTGQDRNRRRQGLRQQSDEGPNEKIAVILDEINTVLIQKIEHRFSDVSRDLKEGQKIILEGASESLQEMNDESVRKYNSLFDLQREYALEHASIRDAVSDYRKAADDLAQVTKDVVIDRSRRSLSNKLPTSIVPKSKELDIIWRLSGQQQP